MDEDRITGAAKEAVGKVQGGAGDTVGSPGNSIEGRFREAQGAGENLYGQAKDAVRDATSRIADRAGDAYGNAGEAIGQGQRELRGRVERNALSAMLIAGAVGYGLAMLLHGRD